MARSDRQWARVRQRAGATPPGVHALQGCVRSSMTQWRHTVNRSAGRAGLAAVLLAACLIANTGRATASSVAANEATAPVATATNVAATAAGGETTADSIIAQVAFEQRLNQQIPLNLAFRDETGRTVKLDQYFGSKPVILALSYYNCPNLCPMLFNGLEKSLMELSFTAGNEFDVLSVSIDPRETPELAMAKKQTYASQLFAQTGAKGGWHFLTGEETSIKPLADAVGFHYAYDPVSHEYAHPAGIMVLTPQGKVSRYLFGIDFAPRDIRLALVEASAGKIGTPVDQILLRCYHYDPVTGKYGLVIQYVLQIASAATVLLLGGLIFALVRYERKHNVNPV